MPEKTRELRDYRFARLQDVLRDRYEFLALLGRGGAASVYEVRYLRLGRVEALKVLAEEHAADIAARFAQEAKLAASLDQPNIVKIYDYGQSEDIFWYSMQLVDGPTLSALLRKLGRMDPEDVARVAVPVLGALDYSHGRGVIHRDIKPANILVDREGRPHLADFGVAKSVESMLKTRTGLVVGTPAYVSPEQARGEPVDARADLYSLGVMLYQMLTGGLPFPADTDIQSVVKRLTVDPQHILDSRPELPLGIAMAVMRALARDREGRHASALAMRVALVTACEEAGILWNGPLSDLPITGAVRKPIPNRPIPAAAAPSELRADTPTLTVQRQGDIPKPAEPPPAARPRRWPFALAALALVLALLAVAYATASLWRSGPAGGPPPDALPKPASPGPPPAAAKAPPTEQEAPSSGGPSATGTAVPRDREPVSAQPRVPGPVPSPPREAAPVIRRAVTYPQLEESFTPALPEGAPSDCAGKQLRLSVRVGEDGLVKEAKPLEKADPECQKAAVEAVKRFRFQPALDADGKPVEAPTAVSVEFPEAP